MAQDAGAAGTEADVVGPGLGRVHAIVARRAAERADDRIRSQFLPCIAHAAGAVGQVHPIKPVAQGKLDVILDHHGHVAGMGDFAREVADAAQVLLGPCTGYAQAGHGKAVHDIGQQRTHRRGRRPDRGDQIKLRRIGFVIHGTVILGVPLPDSAAPRALPVPAAKDMAARMEPAIILVRPQMGENIGAAARAMRENAAMQRIARRFAGRLTFEDGEVVAVIHPPLAAEAAASRALVRLAAETGVTLDV